MASTWGEKMLGYLSLDIICSSKLTVLLELRSRKTVLFSEQMMSADKYPSIFTHQMEAISLYIPILELSIPQPPPIFATDVSVQFRLVSSGNFPFQFSALLRRFSHFHNHFMCKTALLFHFCLTNRFHVVLRLFSNRSQMTSKWGKNKKVAHVAIAI